MTIHVAYTLVCMYAYMYVCMYSRAQCAGWTIYQEGSDVTNDVSSVLTLILPPSPAAYTPLLRRGWGLWGGGKERGSV